MKPKARTRPESVASMERLATLGRLVEDSPAVVFLWRIESERWPVEAVSASVQGFLGYTADDFVSGRVSWPGITHPEDVPRLEREVQEFFANGQNEWHQQYRLLAKDGRAVWVEDWNQVIRNGAGQPTHIQGLVMDITERKRAETELFRHSRQLARLAAGLTQAEHRERRRIAEVIHEDLQQRLVAMKYRISGLKERHRDAATTRDTESLLQELQQSIDITRNLTRQLRPPVLYELGLREALERLTEEMQSQFALHVSLAGEKSFLLPSDDVQAFAFDAVRELLLNVVKHSGVKRATVRIAWQEKDRIAIEVADKGKGFVVALNNSGTFGLFSIRERIEAFGGRFEITSQPGKGTRAVLILPAARRRHPSTT